MPPPMAYNFTVRSLFRSPSVFIGLHCLFRPVSQSRVVPFTAAKACAARLFILFIIFFCTLVACVSSADRRVSDRNVTPDETRFSTWDRNNRGNYIRARYLLIATVARHGCSFSIDTGEIRVIRPTMSRLLARYLSTFPTRAFRNERIDFLKRSLSQWTRSAHVMTHCWNGGLSSVAFHRILNHHRSSSLNGPQRQGSTHYYHRFSERFDTLRVDASLGFQPSAVFSFNHTHVTLSKRILRNTWVSHQWRCSHQDSVIGNKRNCSPQSYTQTIY